MVGAARLVQYAEAGPPMPSDALLKGFVDVSQANAGTAMFIFGDTCLGLPADKPKTGKGRRPPRWLPNRVAGTARQDDEKNSPASIS